MGILSFARRVGGKRLINTCRWADSYGLYSYPAIETILNNRQDEIPREEDVPEDKFTPEPKNIHNQLHNQFQYFANQSKILNAFLLYHYLHE